MTFVGPSLLNNDDEDSKELSSSRETSSIPRSEDGNWMYPSAAMFHAALARKNVPVPADSIPAMLAIHNSLNEQVWSEIMHQYELKYHSSCKQVKLKRFRGRPEDLSPMGWWHWFRHGVLPYDRHDWVVERCGQEVRYIIDYYESGGQFSCVIRPALDSLDACLMRIKGWWCWFS